MLIPLKLFAFMDFFPKIPHKAAGQTVNMSAGLPAPDKGIVPGVVHLSENAPEYKARSCEIVIGKAFNSSGEKAFLSDKLFGLIGIKRGKNILF